MHRCGLVPLARPRYSTEFAPYGLYPNIVDPQATLGVALCATCSAAQPCACAPDCKHPRHRVQVAPPSYGLTSKTQSRAPKPTRMKPCSASFLLVLNDGEIINCYAQTMRGLINYYKPADNLPKVKSLVEGPRRSCALTLARKHKKSSLWVYTTYGSGIELELPSGSKVALPTRAHIRNVAAKF